MFHLSWICGLGAMGKLVRPWESIEATGKLALAHATAHVYCLPPSPIIKGEERKGRNTISENALLCRAGSGRNLHRLVVALLFWVFLSFDSEYVVDCCGDVEWWSARRWIVGCTFQCVFQVGA